MTTLRDMPMITIEQKNRFREAALKVEQERDRLKAELENRSHEPEMTASDAYHHCADLIEPHVVDLPHGTECNEQSLCRSVCGSLAYLIGHWQEARGLRGERDALAAQVAAMAEAASTEGAGRSMRMALDAGPEWCHVRLEARAKAEALEDQALEMIAMNDERDMCSVHGAAKHLQSVAAEYREQTATEAMDAIDGEDGDFANVRGVVERMIAAGYRKQAEGGDQ